MDDTRRSYGLAGLLLAAGLGLAGCQQVVSGVDSAAAARAAVVEPAADGGPARVTLTDRAEHELGIATGAVTRAADGTGVIPFAAVVYDGEGASWAYLRVEPRTYQRTPVSITRVVGDQATLTAGPPTGTEVVTVGAALLVGAEAGISGGE